MKKWIVRLAVAVTIAAMSGAAVWWLMNDAPKLVPDGEQTSTETATEVSVEASSPMGETIAAEPTAKRKSPIYGREISGLPEFCADKLVSFSGCDGRTEITTDQGNTYRLVEIGNQCWFADNSKEIPTTDQGWYGYYDNAEEEPSLGEGLLYSWDAAMNGETRERAQGVCPDGWHVPSVCETVYGLDRKWKRFIRIDTPSGKYTKRQGFTSRGLGIGFWLSEFSIRVFTAETGLMSEPIMATFPTIYDPKVTPQRDRLTATSAKCLRS